MARDGEMERSQLCRLAGHTFLFEDTTLIICLLTYFSAVAIFLTVGCKLSFSKHNPTGGGGSDKLYLPP